MSSSQLPPTTEESAVEAIAKTSELTLRVFESVNAKIDALMMGQTGAYLSSIGSAAAIQLLEDIRDSIKKLETKVDALGVEPARRKTGITGELKLAQEQQAALDSRVWGIQSDSFDLINAFETFKRQMYEEMDRHARKTTPLWRLAWDKLSEWWSSGK